MTSFLGLLSGAAIPKWMLALVAGFVLTLLYQFLSNGMGIKRKRSIISTIVFIPFFYIASQLFYPAGYRHMFDVYVIILLLYIVTVVAKGDFKAKKRSIVFFTLLGIMILSVALRMNEFNLAKLHSLCPDAMYYKAIAEQQGSFYNTGTREPLFILLIKVCFAIFGTSNIAYKGLTVFLSIIMVLLVYKVGRDLFNSELLGLMAAYFTGVHKYLIYMSTRGLRLELFIITILMFTFFALIGKKESFKKLVLIGVAGGLVCLTRITSFTFVFPFIIYSFWKNKWNFKKIYIPILLIVVMIIPHLWHNHKEFGNYTHSMDIHARYYRNQEFKGRPGYPTVAEVTENGYAGESVTTFQYVFGMHDFNVVLKRTRKGFVNTLFGGYCKNWILDKNGFLFSFFMIGFVLILFTKHWFIVAEIIVLTGTSYFLVGTFRIDQRLIMHIYPFVIYIALYVVIKLFNVILNNDDRNCFGDMLVNSYKKVRAVIND